MSSSSSSPPSLQNELSIPQNATLPNLPPNLPSNRQPHLATTATTVETVRIALTPQSSIRTPSSSSSSFLIIGRQLSTADIRIDHKSISRKHAVLYFLPIDDDDDHTDRTTTTTTAGGGGGERLELILQDLGGKHGCHVNSVRVEKGGRKVLVDGDEVRFGNVRERVFVVMCCSRLRKGDAGGDDGDGDGENKVVRDGDNNNDDDDDNDDDETNEPPTPTEAPPDFSHLTGRARREAEIAEMMKTFDAPPTYTKWVDPNQNKEHDESDPTTTTNNNNNNNNNNTIFPPHQTPTTTTTTETTLIAQKHSLPLTSTLTLPYTPPPSSLPSPHPSTLTHLTLDPSGARLLTTSTDATIRLYDFGGLSLSTPTPFKFLTLDSDSDTKGGVGGRYPVLKARFSPSGDRVVVGTADTRPAVLDREGRSLCECVMGDPYVTDMARTNGHVAGVTGVDWHPLEEDLVCSCSVDGSVRVWEVGDGRGGGRVGKTAFGKLMARGGGNGDVIRCKDGRGRRVGVGSVSYAPGGREIVVGTVCGSIQVWRVGSGGGNGGGMFGGRPERVRYDAHGVVGSGEKGKKGQVGQVGTTVHSVVYSANGRLLATRCVGEENVRVWDIKRLGKSSTPVVLCAGVRSLDEYSNCAFSPNGKLLCAGTSVRSLRSKVNKGEGEGEGEGRGGGNPTPEYGKLKIFRVDEDVHNNNTTSPSNPILEIDISLGVSVITTTWHPRLNQILLGLSNGSIKILYDTTLSKKGALLPLAKGHRTIDELSLLLASRVPQNCSVGDAIGPIRTPHALPLFRDEEERKRDSNKRKDRHDREEEDSIRTKRPQPPATGIKMGEGTSARLNFQQFVVSSRSMLQQKNIAGKDPRMELFKYEREGDGKGGGGGRVLAEKTVEEEEEEMMKQG